MIIEKIEIKNFMCYSGDNTFNFNEGINVVIGDNNHGKSKLFDAFYWVLHDKVTENKKFIKTNKNIVSKKAIHDICDGEVLVSVGITFNNRERDRVYVLKRTYSVIVNSGEITDDRNGISMLDILDKEFSCEGIYIRDEGQKQGILNQILPENVQRYLWFQGEQIESIIDFNDQGALTNAINVLSSMSKYDEIIRVAEKSLTSATDEYNKIVKIRSNDKRKSDQLYNEKQNSIEALDRKNERLKEINQDLSVIRENGEKLIGRVSDATEITDLKNKMRESEAELKNVRFRLDEKNLEFLKSMFKSIWVLKGMGKYGKMFGDKYSVYEQKRNEIINRNKIINELNQSINENRLPKNVPEPIYLKQMLDEEVCFVCGREAKKDTEAWNTIKSKINGKSEPEIENKEIFKNNFSTELFSLYRNYLSNEEKIKNINDDIASSIKIRQELRESLKNIQLVVKEYNGKIAELIADSPFSNESPEHIINEFKEMKEMELKYSMDKNNLEKQIAEYNQKIDNIELELQGLVDGEIPDHILKKKKILEDFKLIAHSTKARVFKTLITKLENEANKHYQSMTKENLGIRGHIKLKRLPNGNYIPEIVNDNGQPMIGFNTGNLIMVKLATIMAIISASERANQVNYYTFVADAPFSAFGDLYTVGCCKTISNVYRQSIVMSKEFYNNISLRDKLLSDPEIKRGSIYLIEPSTKGADQGNQENLSIIIKKIN